MIILVLLIATALAFDFTNGFHDTGNAMATSIATGALKPKTAVLLAGVLNLVGAFLSVEVAITVTTSVLKVQDCKTGQLLSGIDPSMGLTIIFAGLIGGILWNLLTWLFGIPSSSSHALFGGLIGAGLAALGFSGVNWAGRHPEGPHPRAGRAGDRRPGRRLRHLAGLPDHPQGAAPPPRGGLPLGPDRHRVAGRAGARHQRRAEDHGRHRAGADHHRTPHRRRQERRPAVLDHRQLRAGHRPGHLHRRLAGHPHPGQGPRRDRVPAGPGRRGLLRGDHPELQRRRHGAVHHPRRHRLDPRQRRRQAGRPGALGGRRPDGGRLADHPARRRAWSARCPTGCPTSSRTSPIPGWPATA